MKRFCVSALAGCLLTSAAFGQALNSPGLEGPKGAASAIGLNPAGGAIYEPTPEALGKAITAEISSHPDVLMGMAYAAMLEQKRHEAELARSVLDYFASHLISMHHAIWVGDRNQENTVFAFVDYSSIYASVFIKALNEFAHKNAARVLLLPGSMDDKSRESAMLVTALAHGPAFAAFIAKLQAAGTAYSGKPQDYLNTEAVKQAGDLGNNLEILDDVDLSHMVLIALGMKQPMAMMYKSRRFVGNMADSDEMTAFYAQGDANSGEDAAGSNLAPLSTPNGVDVVLPSAVAPAPGAPILSIGKK